MLSNRGLGINAKNCLYEGIIIVPTALYGAKAWGMRSAERRKEDVHKCIELSMKRRIRMERELASRADHRVLRWFGHVERMEEYRMARRVLMEFKRVSGGRVRGRPRLGWMDGVKVT